LSSVLKLFVRGYGRFLKKAPQKLLKMKQTIAQPYCKPELTICRRILPTYNPVGSSFATFLSRKVEKIILQ
jgi:hypothetical protein